MDEHEPEDATLAGDRTPPGSAEATMASTQGARRIAEPGPLARGHTLGRYVVLETLGRGGMGVVYAAYDPELDRRVALKLLRLGPRDAGTMGRSRLLREAQAMARLTHPNVVAVYDVGTWEQAVFVAMELVPGQTVAQWLAARREPGERSWAEVLRVFVAAGRGLEAAHAVGLVHRDFKPDNVMIADDGRVLVLDFGLARASDGPLEPSSSGLGAASRTSIREPLTVTGSVMGTPAYMSPEQLSAAGSDAASDQFSFCVSLYVGLYGERPFAGETLPELTASVIAGEVRPAPRGSGVPAWLRRVVVRGLAVEPSERHPSMTTLLAELSRDPARRRNRVLAAVGVLGMAGGVWWASRAGEVEDPCSAKAVGQAMAEAWGPSQREAIERTFRREAQDFGEQSFERVAGALDHYASTWVEQRQETCEAGRQAGTQQSSDAGIRAACLDQRLRRFDAVVRLLVDADQGMVARASEAVGALADPTVCRDEVGYRQIAPMPDDPTVQEEVEALRLEVATLEPMATMGRLREAALRATQLVEQARATGFPPVLAEVLQAAGATLGQAGDFEQAKPLLEEALLLAREHGLDQLAFDSIIPLSVINTAYSTQPELARWQLREAEALVHRLGDPPRLRARVLVDRARTFDSDGEADQGVAALLEAAAIYEHEAPDVGLERVVVYERLAQAYAGLNRHDEAAEALDRAQSLAMASLGPAHPIRGNLLVHRARVEASRGRSQRSVELLQEAGVLYAAVDANHPNLVAVHNGLGLQLGELGRDDEAVASFQRATERGRASFGADHLQVQLAEANLGNLLRRMGRPQPALELHERVLATRERTKASYSRVADTMELVGDDLLDLGRVDEAWARYEAVLALRHEHGERSPDDVHPRLGLGLCQLARDQLEDAQQRLQVVVADLEAAGPSYQNYLATARFGLAITLRARDPASTRALELGRLARAWWATDVAQYGHELRRVDTWLSDGRRVLPLR